MLTNSHRRRAVYPSAKVLRGHGRLRASLAYAAAPLDAVLGCVYPTGYRGWVQNDAEAIGDLLLTIVNALGDALTSYNL